MIKKEIVLTKNDGYYYRAMAFHWTLTIAFLIPALTLMLVAFLNPFWFRQDLIEWTVNVVNKFAEWRNYRKYAIYLDCDPVYWQTLNSTK